ncbi:5-oxoprolinase subunit PxpA [Salinimicrobium flavum]|uniref:5-oxoprolinase subunit PxpA n=1 Tax=Salinimicrobium flavum TaxID=1737065 RepID=A0ABW5IXQ7_9FLAO
MRKIHINCDLGEGGEFDRQLMPLISACNIACGGHAGTLESMHMTAVLAMEHGVQIGAHPSYPDKENFGRETLEIEPDKLQRSLVAQILSLKQITEAEGAKLVHVKPHGALYNDAQKNETIAEAIVNSILEFEEPFALYAPENSILTGIAKGRIKVVYEAFADRNYNPDGSLVERKNPHALITKKEQVLEHLLSMVSEQKITCLNGKKIDCNATTFCLHSDTPNAVEILTYLHRELPKHGIEINQNL